MSDMDVLVTQHRQEARWARVFLMICFSLPWNTSITLHMLTSRLPSITKHSTNWLILQINALNHVIPPSCILEQGLPLLPAIPPSFSQVCLPGQAGANISDCAAGAEVSLPFPQWRCGAGSVLYQSTTITQLGWTASVCNPCSPTSTIWNWPTSYKWVEDGWDCQPDSMTAWALFPLGNQAINIRGKVPERDRHHLG